MATTAFESSENLQLTFEPFINPTTGAVIESGDNVTITVTAPDASHPAGPSATRDSTTKIWTASITTGSYQQGKWLFRATSDDSSNPNPQYRTVFWGTGIYSDVPAVKTKTDNLPSSPASTTDVTSARDSIKGSGTPDIASAITSIEAAIEGAGAHTILDIYNRLGTPVSSIAADIASVKSKTDLIPASPASTTDVTSAASSIESAIQGSGSHTIKDLYDRLGAPAGASTAADIAAVKAVADSALTEATNAAADALRAKRLLKNDWVFDPTAKTITVYDDGGLSGGIPLDVWDLKDSSGNPTSTRIARRIHQ